VQPLPDGRGSVKRWLRFNAVGIGGAVVQLGALALFARVFGMQYVVATILAVEVAVLHNFAWHEVWTWRGLPADERWRRLLRFHAANGFISIASNALFTWLFKRYVGLPLLFSNVTAIALTAILNYILASTWVFKTLKSSPATARGSRPSDPGPQKTGDTPAS
jgi:putative flippase GtrA